jgi:hypothetical protein
MPRAPSGMSGRRSGTGPDDGCSASRQDDAREDVLPSQRPKRGPLCEKKRSSSRDREGPRRLSDARKFDGETHSHSAWHPAHGAPAAQGMQASGPRGNLLRLPARGANALTGASVRGCRRSRCVGGESADAARRVNSASSARHAPGRYHIAKRMARAPAAQVPHRPDRLRRHETRAQQAGLGEPADPL